MRDEGVAPNAAVNKPRRRSPIERTVVWGAIGVLVVVVGLELQARVYFQRAADALSSHVGTIAKHPLLSAEQAERLMGGLYTRFDGRTRGRQKIAYRWWSVFRPYALEIILTDDDRVASINTDAESIQANLLRPSATAGSGPSIDQLLPPKGFADEGKQALRLSTADVMFGDQSGEAPDDVELKVFYGALVREIVRQAFLISGETNFQSATRDQSLGAAMGDSDRPVSFPWTISSRIHRQGAMEVEISRPAQNRPPLRVVLGPFPLVRGRLHESLVEWIEGLSRKEFPDVLRKGGLDGTPLAFEQAGAVAPDALALLDRMDELSQYAAIRQLHAQIGREGESSERLGALVRGYANLGNMTEPHWQLHHKVLKARSLIYAQRLVALTDSSPWALAHRAYAWTLAGRPSAASVDLESLQSLPVGQTVDLPTWLPALRAYCDYRPEVLDDVAQDASLKAYLKLLLANPTTDVKGTMKAAQELLETAPASERVVDLLCQIPTLGIARRLTEGALDEAWPAQYAALAAVSDLPSEGRTIASRQAEGGAGFDEVEDRIHLMKILSEAPDQRAGLSFEFCGRLLREFSFQHAVQSVQVRKWKLGAPADDLIAKFEPTLQDYPYAKFLSAFGTSDPQSAGRQLLDQMTALPPYELDLTCAPLMKLVYQLKSPAAYQRISRQSIPHQDLIEPRLAPVDRVDARRTGQIRCRRSARTSEPAPAANHRVHHSHSPRRDGPADRRLGRPLQSRRRRPVRTGDLVRTAVALRGRQSRVEPLDRTGAGARPAVSTGQ